MKKLWFVFLLVLGLGSLQAQKDLSQSVSGEGILIPVVQRVQKGQTLADFLPLDKTKFPQSDVDAGVAPEGDYLLQSVYTTDGSKVLIANQMTNNISVFDAQTFTLLNNIDVDNSPYDIAVTDDYAIVSCIFGDKIDVIDLNTMSVVASFDTPAGAQPATVRVSPDQQYAYIACDINDQLERIDLSSMQQLTPFTDFPVFLSSFSYAAANNRYSFKFSSFEISPDGSHIIAVDGENSLVFFDAATGNVDFTVDGVGAASTLGMSGDGSKMAVITTDWNSNVIHCYQIDMTSHSISATTDINGHTLSTYEVAVNMDGSKIYLGISDNSGGLVNFNTGNATIFTNTYTPFWLGTTYDHQYAVSGQYRFSIIDFENEEVTGSNWGHSQTFGCVSPVAYEVAAYDPLRSESVLFYSFSDPSVVTLDGSAVPGSVPEGDAPYRVAISADGSKIVSANALSFNATIMNGEDYSVEGIVELGEDPHAVAISPDGNTAVLGGFDLNTIKIVDVNTQTLVKTVYTGQRPMMINISADNNYAYIGNLKGNSVSIVSLDGENSQLLATIPTAVIGLVYTGMGTRSAVVVDPTGNYIVVAGSFENKVQIIDIAAQAIVKEIPVGDFPLKIAFNSAGDTAVVLNYFDNTFNVLHMDGANTTDLGTFSTGGQYPLRIEYNETNKHFGIIHAGSKNLKEVRSPDWTPQNIASYASYGTPIQVHYDANGVPVVLVMGDGDVPGYLVRAGEAVELPATPDYFDFCVAQNKAVVCMPGPDLLTIVDYSLAPQADFTADTTEVTLSSEVHFTDLSTQNPSSWEWNFEGGTPAVSNEQNPVVSYDELGYYDVSLSVENESGSDEITKTDYIHVVLDEGVEDTGKTPHLRIFPNPGNDRLNLLFPETVKEAQVLLFSAQGKLIRTQKLNMQETSLNIEDLPQGVYFVKVKTKTAGEQVLKFVKE